MAEGLGRESLAGLADISSAGSQPTSVNPYAVEVMAEIGIDIQSQSSKRVDAFDGSTLFVNLFGDGTKGSGMTCAIWGPWERGPL